MSTFSSLATALDEKTQGRGREAVKINSVGVCLDDPGKPAKLYIVDAIYAGDDLDVFSIDDDFSKGKLKDGAKPRKVNAADFWALIDLN
jgi:hypothetical protein